MANSVTKSRAFFRQARWQGRRTCPRCSYRRLGRLSDGRFFCRRCRYKFSDFTGTFLGRLHIGLDEVAHLLYLFALGVPTYRARRYGRCSLKTMQRAYTIFSEAVYAAGLAELRRLSGEIELDEALFGGARKGKRGWGAAGKIMVFGLLERSGDVLTFPVSGRGRGTLLPLIQEHTQPGSLYYTDDYHAYASLHLRGEHVVVSKREHVVVSKKEGRPRGRDHINGIEGFWSYAKNWLYKYRGVAHSHFPLYLKEIEFRFNHRDENLFDLIAHLIVQSVPKST